MCTRCVVLCIVHVLCCDLLYAMCSYMYYVVSYIVYGCMCVMNIVYVYVIEEKKKALGVC